MIVKVGNQVFDSGKEIITVKLTPGEKDFIAHMPTKDDLVSIYPDGTNTDEVATFNKVFELARKKQQEAPTAVPQEIKQRELPLSDPAIKQVKAMPPLKMPVPASKDTVDVVANTVPKSAKKAPKSAKTAVPKPGTAKIED